MFWWPWNPDLTSSTGAAMGPHAGLGEALISGLLASSVVRGTARTGGGMTQSGSATSPPDGEHSSVV